ncbi:multidrug effflux MFS transporter [Rhizobium sp. L1K21]|uniref:multidrug effflux MFS transporter n=1 Tax=Rhizobium sp. L1K21 TaxID=2954933 RepID=UPI00209303FE|nr:multidrug effflux MFS transporter [Rhizobium sp. L1K21]MCO6186427.1 multidrug effflux MFS transporter [Rhizobium sp. L1K21]
MTSRYVTYVFLLGFFMATGVSALDIYLPSLPAIASDFHADAGAVQLTVTAYFVAMAVAQLIYGPLSDMLGRKLPLTVGFLIYAIGAIGCSLSTDIEWLIAMRFLQGLGAGAGSVIARAIVRDLYTGAQAARMMSTLMLVFSVSPILAPLAGSLIVTLGGWRDVFWALSALGIVGVFLAAFVLEETRTREKRAHSSISSMLGNYGTLLRDPYYLGIMAIASFGMSTWVVYMTGSSFVLIDHFGLSPMGYSVAFSVNAASFISVSQLNGRLAARFGLRRVVRTGVLATAVTMIAFFAVRYSGVDSLPVMLAFLFVGYGALGLVVPSSFVLALETYGHIAGTASALMGTCQFAISAAMAAIVSLFFDGTSLPMVAGIATCAAIVLVASLITLRGAPAAVTVGE